MKPNAECTIDRITFKAIRTNRIICLGLFYIAVNWFECKPKFVASNSFFFWVLQFLADMVIIWTTRKF